MKKTLYYIIVFCLLIIACQKGIHWDLASEGKLVKDFAGNCLPITVAGTFTKNKPAGDTNFLIVSVNVTAAGNYSITTDSVNGYI